MMEGLLQPLHGTRKKMDEIGPGRGRGEKAKELLFADRLDCSDTVMVKR